jgi:hypothetical protein
MELKCMRVKLGRGYKTYAEIELCNQLIGKRSSNDTEIGVLWSQSTQYEHIIFHLTERNNCLVATNKLYTCVTVFDHRKAMLSC